MAANYRARNEWGGYARRGASEDFERAGCHYVCARHERSRNPGPFARSLRGRRLRRSRQRGHRRRPRGDRRMAEPAAGAALCTGVLRRHPGQGARRRHGAQQSRLRRSRGSTRRYQGNPRPVDRADRGREILAARHERAEAITAVFPQTQVQTCIVHLIRNSLDFVSYKDRKAVAAPPKQIYRAKDAAAGQEELNIFAEAAPSFKIMIHAVASAIPAYFIVAVRVRVNKLTTRF